MTGCNRPVNGSMNIPAAGQKRHYEYRYSLIGRSTKRPPTDCALGLQAMQNAIE